MYIYICIYIYIYCRKALPGIPATAENRLMDRKAGKKNCAHRIKTRPAAMEITVRDFEKMVSKNCRV